MIGLSVRLWSPIVMVGRGLLEGKAKVVKIMTLLEQTTQSWDVRAGRDFKAGLRFIRSGQLPKVINMLDQSPSLPPSQWPSHYFTFNATVQTPNVNQVGDSGCYSKYFAVLPMKPCQGYNMVL